jgi:Transposase
MFVGWDWASTTHDVTIIDDAGNIVDRWAPEHTERGLDATLARLTRHGRPEQLPVAIERPSGLVVDRLLAAGHPVIPIHPNAFHAARARWGAAAAKSDPGDSFKLADDLRTDGHRLRRLRPLDAATRELQALSRLRDDHVAAKTAASNQLGALLEAHWPGAKQVFSRLGSQIALTFLDAYPTPESAARLGEALPSCSGGCGRHQQHRSVLLPRCSLGWWAPRSDCCTSCWPPSPTWIGRWGRAARACQGRAAGPAPTHRRGQPCPGRRRGRPDPGPCQHRRARHGRVRRRTGHQSVRQDQGGHLPVGGQHQGPQRPCHLRQQLPAQLTLGGQGLRRRPPPRQAPSPRRPHPRSGLAASHVGLLAQRHHLRPRQAQRRTAARRPNLTQETQAHRCPTAVSAPGAHGHQPRRQIVSEHLCGEPDHRISGRT